jgi:hypothetical protein
MTWIWGVLAMAALLWPDRLSGPLDGIPLDRAIEAVLVGAVVPALWVFHSRFLATRLARASIIALLLWRTLATISFVQDGWCLRFEPSRPYTRDAIGAPHSWDLRADWRDPDPACSAIMTRSYASDREFPAWFFNLPPAALDRFPVAEDRPPEATVGLKVRGYLSTPAAGVLDIELGPSMKPSIAIDGRQTTLPAQLDAGTHHIAVDSTLTGTQWRMLPRWNGADLWSSATATVRRPSLAALPLRWWARWIPLTLTLLFVAGWTASFIARIQQPAIVAWTIAMSSIVVYFVRSDRVMTARWAMVLLFAAVFVPIRPRLRNMFGAFVLIGIPWLTFIVAAAMPAVGRWVLYEAGNDFWTYQRFAYRIVMQGYWLEGGSTTFYFQPLYRWTAALLHIMFGDSSMGEWYWDGACLLAGSLLAFRITRAFAGFRWGLVAAVAPLLVFSLSNARDLIGVGLSEISSAGLMSIAAICAIGSRHHRTSAIVAAGVFATLAFYTRLNHLLMAFGVALFALPLRLPVRAMARPSTLWRRIAWQTAIGIPAVIGVGLLCFAWRTWYYTGVFSVFHGTQRYIVAIWEPGMTFGAVAYRMAYNVMMILTVNDPPRFDIYASPVLVGAVIALFAVCGLPRFRDLPAAAVLYFFASIAGAFIARGWAYAGRFSVHVMPITCTLVVCGAAALAGATRLPRATRLLRSDARGAHAGGAAPVG